MQTAKPKIVRSYIQITDPNTRKSIAFTVYGVTPKQVKDALTKKSVEKNAEETAAA